MSEQPSYGVLRQFGIEPAETQVLRRHPLGKIVWLVTAVDGTRYVLKRLRHPERAAMIPALSHYLVRKGVPVVATLPTAAGEPFVAEGETYLLFPWVEGNLPVYEQAGMIERITTLLSRYHLASDGYAATGAPVAWEEDLKRHYKHWLKRLHQVEADARRTDDPFSRMVIRHLPWLHARIAWGMDHLPKAGLKHALQALHKRPLISHGDYSRDNLLLTPPGELMVIDLDQAAVSLPIWDLSRLITWINHDLQAWSAERMALILRTYEQGLPLSRAETDLLLVDQVFPHQALSLARQYYNQVNNPTLPQEFERCLATDRVKLAALELGPAP